MYCFSAYSAQLSPRPGSQGTQFNGSSISKIAFSSSLPIVFSRTNPSWCPCGSLLLDCSPIPICGSPWPFSVHNVPFSWHPPMCLSPCLQTVPDFFRDRFKPMSLALSPETPSSALQSSGHITCPWALPAFCDLGNLSHSCHSLLCLKMRCPVLESQEVGVTNMVEVTNMDSWFTDGMSERVMLSWGRGKIGED